VHNVQNSKSQIPNKFQPKIFEISPHPSPLPNGGEGGGEGAKVKKFEKNSQI
jgi:hypothetical protein